jgi:hypothetical protein
MSIIFLTSLAALALLTKPRNGRVNLISSASSLNYKKNYDKKLRAKLSETDNSPEAFFVWHNIDARSRIACSLTRRPSSSSSLTSLLTKIEISEIIISLTNK